MSNWLENALMKYNKQTYLLALAVLILAGALVAIDLVMPMSITVSPRSLRSIGKGFGEAARNLAAAAMAYYVLREVFVLLLKKGVLASNAGVMAYLKTGVSVLRLLHPAMGILVLALVVIHGYIMWFSWGGLSGGARVASGLALASAGVILASLGGWLLVFRQKLEVRRSHKYVAFVAVVLFVFHKIIAG